MKETVRIKKGFRPQTSERAPINGALKNESIPLNKEKEQYDEDKRIDIHTNVHKKFFSKNQYKKKSYTHIYTPCQIYAEEFSNE